MSPAELPMQNIYSIVHSVIHLLIPKFNLTLIGAFKWLTPLGSYRATTCRERELTQDHIHIFLTTQGHGGPPRMRVLLNAGATVTWNTIHIIHAPIHANKGNMEGWLWRPNEIRGLWWPKAYWQLSYGWQTPKKPHPGNLFRPGIKPGPLRERRACSTVVDYNHLSEIKSTYYLLIVVDEINWIHFIIISEISK